MRPRDRVYVVNWGYGTVHAVEGDVIRVRLDSDGLLHVFHPDMVASAAGKQNL